MGSGLFCGGLWGKCCLGGVGFGFVLDGVLKMDLVVLGLGGGSVFWVR